MVRKIIPLFLYILVIAAFSSCRQDNGSPIRNVRFDPNLLSQAKDGSACTSYSYSYNGQEKSLGTVFTRQVLVTFAAGTTYDVQKSAIEKYGFVNGISGQTSSESEMLYTLSLMEGLSCHQTEQVIKILAQDKLITYAAPFFVQQDNLLGVSNEAIVTVQSGGKATLDRTLQSYGASLVGGLDENTYIVKVDKNASGNALDLANFLQGQEGIAHAEPNFVVSQIQETPARIREYRDRSNGSVRR
ncbi:hypothetical protein ACSX1A_11530 [Pontibacter sp. MBLB2868]|uniref:hypothetical protein n=1 Tax=Pontibacter sp. MBLB2868 TaxID=3451555 RepID=UPI003F756C76